MKGILVTEPNGWRIPYPPRAISIQPARVQRPELKTAVLLSFMILALKILLCFAVLLVPWTAAF